MFFDLLRLSRPRDWIKNVFVLMPVPFALASGAVLEPQRFLLGLFAFCLANSAVYSFNDLQDADRDAQDPKKKHRPIAAGRISKPVAAGWSVALLSVGAFAARLTGSSPALSVLLVYALLNLIYSLGGKHIPLLDVFLLSSGFVLRVLLGCALLDVPPSHWLLLCSSTLALYLALAKRWSDLDRGLDGTHRPSLDGYNLGYLDQAMGIMAGMAMIAYALYCIEAGVFVPGREFASVPFVLFGVLEYLRLVHVRKGGSSPVDLLLSSPSLLLTGVGWLAATIWSLSWT